MLRVVDALFDLSRAGLKGRGRIRYIGITTSHGRKYWAFADIMRTQPIDFVQFTYNVRDREAEDVLLPLAAERKLAVIINWPFQRGELFDAYEGKPLPRWPGEIGCQNWAQFFLKFVITHPTVTCAIPATSWVDHMIENMNAGHGPMPDAAMRARMADYVESL
jgi:aryl-alcohol dehydrogenase-like predicted oxidoreductase